MSGRVEVRKTYKLYVDGDFPRSESGRTYPALDHRGEVAARAAAAGRKDLRAAVRAARRAQPGWAARTGYNRGQIIYRIAEMVEDRAASFADRLRLSGASAAKARREAAKAVDRLVWYAGWADKYQQVLGNLNPVSGPFFNISAPEPTGVVGVIAPESPALLGLVSRLAPVMAPGNAAVVLASERWPAPAVALAEAMAAADVPGGVVNILTGPKQATAPYLASHLDVDALDLCGADPESAAELEEAAAAGVKRVVLPPGAKFDWMDDQAAQSPYAIAPFTEIKTVWHPKGL